MGEEEQPNDSQTTNESISPEEILNRIILPLEQQIANQRARCLFTLYYPEEYGSMESKDVSSLRSLMICENCSRDTDVFIHSGGGNIDAAYKMAKLFQKKCGNVNALIPEFAKSAATLLAIGCNRIEFSAIAEIGPLDPIIYTPDNDYPLPGFSIRDTPKILEEEIANCDDPEVRKLKAEFIIGPMAAKINPYLLTTVKNLAPLAHIYGTKLLRFLGYSETVAKRILKRLVYESGRPSHGYVIDLDEAIELGLSAVAMEESIENNTLNLLQFYRNYENQLKVEGSPLRDPIFHLTHPSAPISSPPQGNKSR